MKFLDYKVSRIDKLISIRQQQIAALKDLKKAIISKAVTKGDWKRVRLKQVAKLNPICSSQGIKPDDEVTFAPMECIRTDKRIELNATLSKNNSSYNTFNEGDIALAKVTPCFENGNVCIMENLTRGYAFGSSELFNIRPLSIKPRYLLYYLMTDSFRNGGVANMTGSAGLKRVPATYVQNALIPCPPLSEQIEIATYLDKKCAQTNNAIDNTRRQINELNDLKARLISDTVTGKIDVRGITIND